MSDLATDQNALRDGFRVLVQLLPLLAAHTTASTLAPIQEQLNLILDHIERINTQITHIPMRTTNCIASLESPNRQLTGPHGPLVVADGPVTLHVLAAGTVEQLDAINVQISLPDYPANGSKELKQRCIGKFLGVYVPV